MGEGSTPPPDLPHLFLEYQPVAMFLFRSKLRVTTVIADVYVRLVPKPKRTPCEKYRRAMPVANEDRRKPREHRKAPMILVARHPICSMSTPAIGLKKHSRPSEIDPIHAVRNLQHTHVNLQHAL